MEYLHFQALERPTETSDATVAVAPDLCVGRSSFTYANLNKSCI